MGLMKSDSMWMDSTLPPVYLMVRYSNTSIVSISSLKNNPASNFQFLFNLHCSMGRTKLVMKKIEDPTSRQQFYSKRKDTILKKSNELAVLCDVDVGLLMFSPAGEVTSYSSKERLEDVMLLAMNKAGELNKLSPENPNEQALMDSLTQSKHEAEMVEKIAIVEAHEEKLNGVKERLSEAQQKIRYYEPQVESINSVQEADAYEKFILSALELIQLSKAKLLGDQEFLQRNENVAVSSVNAEDMAAEGTSGGWMY